MIAVAMVLSGLIGAVAVVSGVPDIVVTLRRPASSSAGWP